MLPGLDAEGLLPVGVHTATLDDVRTTFVDNAPFKVERARLFSALELYAELVWEKAPSAVLWIDGGFVTHKSWAAPEDVDVAVLVSASDLEWSLSPDGLRFWTLQEVSVGQPNVPHLERVQPMSGLVDGFFVPASLPAAVAYWRGLWQRLKGINGAPDIPDAKGFVEVTGP